MTVDRQCGSSQQSVHFAAAGVIAGHYDVVVAGGVESMTRVPMGVARARAGDPVRPADASTRYGGDGLNQGVGAEMIAERWGLSRTQLDEYSRCARTSRPPPRIDDGPLRRADRAGDPARRDRRAPDEGIRRGGTRRDARRAASPRSPTDGVITAGNSSQISDGAAALLMTTSEQARELGLTPARAGAHRRRSPATTRSSC